MPSPSLSEPAVAVAQHTSHAEPQAVPDVQPAHVTEWTELVPQKRAPRASSRLASNASRLVAPVVFVLAWQVASSSGLVDPVTIPAPSDVFSALSELAADGILWDSLAISVRRALLGFAYGAAGRLGFGLITGLSSVGERAFDALLQMLRTVPFLALIPLFVVWFGIGEEPKIILVAVSCTFPIYLNTFAGVRSVDSKVLEAARVFGLGPIARAFQITVPLAMPSILVGIRYSLAISFLALVGAEQINATSGIGYLALSPRAVARTDIVIGVIVVYALLGLAVDLVVRGLERVVTPWFRATYRRV